MTPQDFDFIRKLLLERSAIVLEVGKEYLVETRLAALVRQHNLRSISDLVASLRSGPLDGLAAQVIDALVTTETSFFRDLHPFESLRTTVLPELIRRRRAERCLNIWSAASSSGQEVYSLAMLLREHFPELGNWTVGLLATDLSGEILNRARAGKYNQIEVNRGLPATLLIKYFEQHGTTWQLREDLRRSVEFREFNLAKPWPTLPRMDLVLLRNVMIYFDVETKKAILTRLARVLHPEGYVILGGAETTFNLADNYRRVENIKGGFYQLVSAKPMIDRKG